MGQCASSPRTIEGLPSGDIYRTSSQVPQRQAPRCCALCGEEEAEECSPRSLWAAADDGWVTADGWLCHRSCYARWRVEEARRERERARYDQAKELVYPRPRPSSVLRRLPSEEAWIDTDSFAGSHHLPEQLAELDRFQEQLQQLALSQHCGSSTSADDGGAAGGSRDASLHGQQLGLGSSPAAASQLETELLLLQALEEEGAEQVQELGMVLKIGTQQCCSDSGCHQSHGSDGGTSFVFGCSVQAAQAAALAAGGLWRGSGSSMSSSREDGSTAAGSLCTLCSLDSGSGIGSTGGQASSPSWTAGAAPFPGGVVLPAVGRLVSFGAGGLLRRPSLHRLSPIRHTALLEAKSIRRRDMPPVCFDGQAMAADANGGRGKQWRQRKEAELIAREEAQHARHDPFGILY